MSRLANLFAINANPVCNSGCAHELFPCPSRRSFSRKMPAQSLQTTMARASLSRWTTTVRGCQPCVADRTHASRRRRLSQHSPDAWHIRVQRLFPTGIVADPGCCLASAGDGFIDAKDLRSFLGPAANVESLIKQASSVPAALLSFTRYVTRRLSSLTMLPHQLVGMIAIERGGMAPTQSDPLAPASAGR
jgi:hypothetical protein